MKKTISFIFIAFLLINTASAFTFLNIYLNNNGESTFIGETSDSPSLPIGIQNKNNDIFGKTQTLTNKNGDLWSFSYDLEGANINLILPVGSIIKSISNGDITTSNNQISVSFSNSINISYIIDENVAKTDKNPNLTLLAVVLVILLIIMVVFLLNYSKRDKHDESKKDMVIHASNEEVKLKINEQLENTNKQDKKTLDKFKILNNILSKKEKKIINQLKKSGKIKQSHLRKLTEIPKASFSRHVQELDKKKLIKRSGEGKNKFIELIN